jgi:hypothetical protein
MQPSLVAQLAPITASNHWNSWKGSCQDREKDSPPFVASHASRAHLLTPVSLRDLLVLKVAVGFLCAL